MRSLLIRDTTRQERGGDRSPCAERLRRKLRWLQWLRQLRGGRIETIYQPYIDGEKELSQINEEYSASRGLIR